MSLSGFRVLLQVRSNWCFSATLCLVLSGCGYVGLDDALNRDLEGLGGDGAGSGGQGDGGEDPQGGGGNDTGASGGSSGSTGGTNEGTGGRLGTGGSTTLPGYPCSTDCDEPFLLYRSFELGTPVLPEITGGGRVERSSSTVYAGDHAMHFIQGMPNSHARIGEKIDRVSSQSIYFRSWVFLPKGSVTEWINLLGLEGATSPGMMINVRASGAIDSFAQSDFELVSSEEGSVPWDRWFCLQVGVDVRQVAGSVVVSIDGKTAVTQTGIDTRPGEGIERIVYGLGDTGVAQNRGAVYFDEVVVSREPVTCD